MDIVLLSRIQFAVTIGFHYLYPPLSIGLGLMLVVMEGLYLKTGNPLYHQMTRFWVRIFGLIFAFGVGTRHRHGVRVRHQLVAVLAVRGRHLRQPAGGRGHLRLLPRVGLPGDPALRLGPRGAADALLRDA